MEQTISPDRAQELYVRDQQATLIDPALNATYKTNRYAIGNLKYPGDLGQLENQQFVAFYINVRGKSEFNKENRIGVVENVNRAKLTSDELGAAKTGVFGVGGAVGGRTLAGAINSTVSNDPRFNNEKVQGVVNAAGTIGGGAAGLALSQADIFKADKSERISDVITLYVDAPPMVKYSAKYANTELGVLTGLLAQGGMALKDIVTGDVQALINRGGALGEGIGAAILSLAKLPSAFGIKASETIQAAAKVTTNPFREVLFEMMDFRTFGFKYKFMPRNDAELNSVKNIINTFKFHMHPELSENRFFLIYPAEFKIVYYMRNSVNNFVHKIGTCALTDMSIEYGSGDYTTFSDGRPTEINLSLTFQETEMLTKEQILAGY